MLVCPMVWVGIVWASGGWWVGSGWVCCVWVVGNGCVGFMWSVGSGWLCDVLRAGSSLRVVSCGVCVGIWVSIGCGMCFGVVHIAGVFGIGVVVGCVGSCVRSIFLFVCGGILVWGGGIFCMVLVYIVFAVCVVFC